MKHFEIETCNVEDSNVIISYLGSDKSEHTPYKRLFIYLKEKEIEREESYFIFHKVKLTFIIRRNFVK